MDVNLSINSTSNNQPQCQWNSIDWPKAYKTVRKLRGRIYKATKRGDAKTARRLQKLMLHSSEGRRLAVRKISQIAANKKTLGGDQLLVHTAAERGRLVDQLEAISLNGWSPAPARAVSASKGGRPEGLPIRLVLDQCLQQLVKSALEPEWEAKFERSSYGFRPGRSRHDAIARMFNNLAPARGKKLWAVSVNISRCLDTISHAHLLETVGEFPARGLIKRWLECGHLDRAVFHRPLTGAPQDGVIGPLLANIALHGLEACLGITYNPRGETLGDRALTRYADDLLVFCQTEPDGWRVKSTLEGWLAARGLEPSKATIKIAHVDDGLDFLGTTTRRFRVSGTKTRLIIKPSKGSILRCHSRLKGLWVQGYGSPTHLTVRRLNAFVRGWSSYFRHYVSTEVFSALDNKMFSWAYRYTSRTHPAKSWSWRRGRYFGRFNPQRRDRWVFGDKQTGQHLLKFAWFSIQRHAMVKGDCSPDDPDLAEYWGQRDRAKTKLNLLSTLDQIVASKQGHVCPLCKESLCNGEALHRHQKVPRKEGGKAVASNLVFLHLLCHQQIYKSAD